MCTILAASVVQQPKRAREPRQLAAALEFRVRTCSHNELLAALARNRALRWVDESGEVQFSSGGRGAEIQAALEAAVGSNRTIKHLDACAAWQGVAVPGCIWQADAAAGSSTATVFLTLHCAAANHSALLRAAAAAVSNVLDVKIDAVKTWPLSLAGPIPPWLAATSAWDPPLEDDYGEPVQTRFPGSEYAAMALEARLAEEDGQAE